MVAFLRRIFFISKDDFERTVATNAMEISERLITEMGAEVHDDLIQKFSIFRFYIDRIERSYKDPVEVLSLTSKMNSEFQVLNDSIRKVSRRLMPVNFDADSFQSAVRILCNNMERPGMANIHLQCVGDEVRIEHRKYHFLLRMIQELIHNAQRHSAAWHIIIRVINSSNNLLIEVEDDGASSQGLSKTLEVLKTKQNSLRLRALAIGALISYEDNGKQGVLVKINFPLSGSVISL